MNPLSGLFGSAVAVRNAFYDRGLLKQQRLQGPVVSIGNLCVGGTGKTPFAQLLGDILIERGISFDILSRGYGRKSKEVAVVDPQGVPEEFGDEPLLLAQYFAGRQTIAPGKQPNVIVGPDRYQAGVLAEGRFGPRMHLLDDGFQHRRLARDFDIVLLAPDDSDQVLLPVGRLREPVRSLQRADAVVATAAVKIEEFPFVPPRIWRVERDISMPKEITPNARVVAFCGIARPDRFFTDLRRQGIYPAAELTFRDHHRYSTADVEKIRREISGSRADCCVTTIKDMMNLGHLSKSLAPVFAIQLKLRLADQEAAIEEMLHVVNRRKAANGR